MTAYEKEYVGLNEILIKVYFAKTWFIFMILLRTLFSVLDVYTLLF